ncbi:hypothetical protein [Kordiimonas sp.]|uniref:hypothetical protein n=1 Tax=Kordiimonas sp. TaxID=1970157 RepID=UPI003A8DA3FC
MFKSNRSIVISTLLTGTAVATGTLLYGMYQEDDELSILDDSLPPLVGNGILPPPATYVMTTPPPVEIPGIRRLKIVRPALANPSVGSSDASAVSNNGATAQAAEQFYLTGTRSADLIRSPVEARIETFPTVTLEEAVEGALAVDEWGFQVVQSYLNQAMGDDEALKVRMEALLRKIEEAAGDYDLATISDAANLIIEAGARTHWTAFMAPFVLDENFKLTEGAIGWDLGPTSREPYDKFTRVGADNKMLIGEGMADEASPSGPSILSNGVHNVEQFVASNIPNGRYRVVILTAPRPNGRSPLYPFGVDVKRNGGNVNMVDTRATDDLVPVMKLSTGGPGRLADAPDEAPTITSMAPELEFQLSAVAEGSLVNSQVMDLPGLGLGGGVIAGFSSSVFGMGAAKSLDTVGPFLQADGSGGGSPASGHMLVTRAEVVDGTLRISFRQLGGQDTYVTAVIIYPEADNEIEEELAEEVAAFIERIAPAAGQNISVESVLNITTPIIDPVAVFADNSNGLPTQESESATPTPPTSSPEPEPEPEPETEPPVQEPPEETPVPTPDDRTPDLTDPPTTAPPATDPPTTAPPSTSPPATDPPTTAPPVTDPPVTDPPTTAPPTTEPPTTAPPTTEPPTTAPPTTEPPTTEPPTTEPPEPAQYELVAEAGVYDPIPLGEDFTLNGCGTTFEAELYCQLTDLDEFDLQWVLGDTILGEGQSLSLTSGLGTNFGATGSYEVTLRILYNGRVLENGEIITVGSGISSQWYAPGDLILTSLDTAIIQIISVPAPAGFLLLAPGLVYVTRRERKKRREKKQTD